MSGALKPLTQNELAADLRRLGLRAGDTVMLHSSLSSPAVCHDILDFSARVFVSIAGQLRRSTYGRLIRLPPEP